MRDQFPIPDLTGRVTLVTGGNAGLGRETVKSLALHGAKVYMAARSEKRASQAINEIYAQNPGLPKGRIVWLSLDLSDLSQVITAAEEFMSKETRLDVLGKLLAVREMREEYSSRELYAEIEVVNNAGIGVDDFVTTKEGFESTVAVNHIGHFVLTNKLLHLLKATAAAPGSDARVVTVSSVAERLAPASNRFASTKSLSDPCALEGSYKNRTAMFRRYALSKQANILFTREFQRRMDADQVDLVATSLNPGPVSTDGGAGTLPSILQPVFRLLSPAPERGALLRSSALLEEMLSIIRSDLKDSTWGNPGSRNRVRRVHKICASRRLFGKPRRPR